MCNSVVSKGLILKVHSSPVPLSMMTVKKTPWRSEFSSPVQKDKVPNHANISMMRTSPMVTATPGCIWAAAERYFNSNCWGGPVAKHAWSQAGNSVDTVLQRHGHRSQGTGLATGLVQMNCCSRGLCSLPGSVHWKTHSGSLADAPSHSSRYFKKLDYFIFISSAAKKVPNLCTLFLLKY